MVRQFMQAMWFITQAKCFARWFYDNGEPIRCLKCGSMEMIDRPTGWIDRYYGPVCESYTDCKNCGHCLGFWAYGSYHPDNMLDTVHSLTESNTKANGR